MEQATLAMHLIIHAGDAKSKAMSAIAAAREGDPAGAQARLVESAAAMTEAHRRQTDILQESAKDPDQGIIMLMAHAQDHIMNAITTYELAKEICALYARMDTPVAQ